jgi:hypothetical protein
MKLITYKLTFMIILDIINFIYSNANTLHKQDLTYSKQSEKSKKGYIYT